MNINDLESKLNRITNELNMNTTDKIVTNIKNSDLFKNLDYNDRIQIKKEYYSSLPKHEQLYQKKNEEYKQLISQFSKSYLELCDFYVGSELPRETYLDSKKDILELFTLFILFALWEPYINAYYAKFIVNHKEY